MAGLLTISLSIAGICEISLSFVSVGNAMRLFLPYRTIYNYRKRIIAES